MGKRIVESRMRNIMNIGEKLCVPAAQVNDSSIVLLTDATRKTQLVRKGVAIPDAYINIIRDM